MKKNIAVVMGGYSSEYKISLKSGQVVCDNLDKNNYNVFAVHIFKDKWVLVKNDTEYPIDKHDFSTKINNSKCFFHYTHDMYYISIKLTIYNNLLNSQETRICRHYATMFDSVFCSIPPNGEDPNCLDICDCF